MSAKIRMTFWTEFKPFKVENEEIAYMIATEKQISDVTAIGIMTGGKNILSLDGNGCGSLISGKNQPSICIDLDTDSLVIWITNEIADDRIFETKKDFKKWVYDYLTKDGWVITEIDEQDVKEEFLEKYVYGE